MRGGDALGGEHGLELRDLVDGVDVVEALDAVAIALMDGVDAQETGPLLGAGFTALADGHRSRLRLEHAHALACIGGGVAQVIQV